MIDKTAADTAAVFCINESLSKPILVHFTKITSLALTLLIYLQLHRLFQLLLSLNVQVCHR